MKAGTATRDISPTKPIYLGGYPHTPRVSTGVHDPLLASALCLDDEQTSLVLVSIDNLFAPQDLVRECRREIEAATGIPAANILVSATHTHSAPVTVDLLAWRHDPIVPPPDPEYLEQSRRGIVEAAVAAHATREPARLAVTTAEADGVGCNRLDPDGPFDPEVGLIYLTRETDRRPLALALIYGMHPTVLHEDSTLATGDFPAFTREYLAKNFPGLTTVYHLGACGNLSTRHHVRGQTFAEAERLGNRLGEQVAAALRQLKDGDFATDVTLGAATTEIELVPNTFPSVEEARRRNDEVHATYRRLQAEGAPRGEVRTAECATFGSEEAVTLAEAQVSGELAKTQQRCNPAEVQVFRVGDTSIVALPCEIFVEYGLELKRRAPGRTFAITLANGQLGGYIVTPEAAAAGGYEAAFSMFKAESGERLVDGALQLMKELA